MIRLLMAATRLWLGDGEVQQRLTGLVQQLEQHGDRKQAEQIRRHTGQHELDTPAQVDATVNDLRALSKDGTALSKAGISGRDLAGAIEELEGLKRHLAAPSGGAPHTAAVQRAEHLFTAYARQSQVALDAIYTDGYADFVDTFGGTDRVRPDDAADALLRLNAAVYSVYHDLRAGVLAPSTFGKQAWGQVDGRAMYALAMQRLKQGQIDFDKEIPLMRSDAAWRQQPLRIHNPGDSPRELTPDNISSFWKRSIYSATFPSKWAQSFEELQFAYKISAGAIDAADGRGSQEAATIDTAYAFFNGQGIAANASQALAAMVSATQVGIYTDIQVVPASTTPAQLEQQQQQGKIDGFVLAPGGGYFTYRGKSIPEIARDIKATLDTGELDNLPASTRRAIGEMIGPAGSPGATLQQRMDSEGSGKFWRQFSSEVITIAAVGLASGGIGAIAEGAAIGLNAGRFSIGAARFLATSASFTTLMGATQGKLSAQQYAMDMAMFGVLGAAGRFSKLAREFAPGGRFVKLLAGHATAVTASAGVLTGFNILDQMAKGREPNWQSTREQFLRNLAMITVLHGINQGVQRLGPAAQGKDELARKVMAQDKVMEQTLNEMHDVLTRVEPAKEAVNQARASGNKDALRDAERELNNLYTRRKQLFKTFDSQSDNIRALQQELIDYAKRTLPPDQAAQVIRDYGTDPADLQRVAQIRAKFGVDPVRNIAFAEIDVTGIPEKDMVAISGNEHRPGTVDFHEQQSLPAIKQGNNPRIFDTEIKILNDLAPRLKPSARGTIRLFTERCPCISCSAAIKMFMEKFPGIKLIVNHGAMQ